VAASRATVASTAITLSGVVCPARGDTTFAVTEPLHRSLNYSFNQVQQSKSEQAYPDRSDNGH
jgi:hypothetical protein